ncbi:MAG: helix-turn-helix domain-containing protein, partial [Hyphomonadaceae bacterium]
CGLRRPSELIGKRAANLFPGALARQYEAWDKAVLETGRVQPNRLALASPMGVTGAWLLFSRAPVRNQAGSVVGVAAAARRLRPHDGELVTSHRLKVVVDHIRRRFAEPIRVEKLAQLAKISRSQLERDFIRLFGVTPREFLNKARIEHALSLMQTDAKIAEIAYRCGYTDQSAFSRRFRLAVGMSPRQYRALSGQAGRGA